MMQNPMHEIKVGKVVINIGCGEAGEKLERAKKLLALLTGKKVIVTKAHKRTTFGTVAGRPLGVAVTLRGEDAKNFLERALDAVDYKLKPSVFDKQGNFSFGVHEHINLPKVKYDPEIGIYGMDVCVRLERKGYRVARKSEPSKIGKQHKIRPEDAREWAIKNLGVKVEE